VITVVETHGFPVLQDAVRRRLSLQPDEEDELVEKWSAHSCLAWLSTRDVFREPPDSMADLRYYLLLGVPDEFRPDVSKALKSNITLGVFLVC